jgi:chaperonin GroES
MGKWRPLHERVIVKEIPTPDKTQGGLLIPAEAQEIPTTAVVLMVGNLVNKEGEDIRVGDTVMYMKYAGLPISVEGEACRILMCNDIICVRGDSEDRKKCMGQMLVKERPDA